MNNLIMYVTEVQVDLENTGLLITYDGKNKNIEKGILKPNISPGKLSKWKKKYPVFLVLKLGIGQEQESFNVWNFKDEMF